MLVGKVKQGYQNIQRLRLVMEEFVHAELGRPINELFRDFSTQPMASASIAKYKLAAEKALPKLRKKISKIK